MTLRLSHCCTLLALLATALFSTSALAATDDTCAGATTISLSTSYGRTLSPSVDWYKVSVSAVGDLKVVLSGPSGSDFDLFVYSSCSASVPLGSGETSSASETVQFPMSYSGYYYIKVQRYSGTGTGYGISTSVISSVTSASLSSENPQDYTVYSPNTAFTKTWTLYNNGTTTWNSGYYVQYQSGPMSQATTKYISGSVAPGYSYSFSVPMKTPASNGTYTDYWSFKSSSGTTIKVGGSSTIWALISVVGTDSASLNSENPVDNTQLVTNTTFNKTWTLYNNGSTTWTSSYSIQYQSGPMSTNTSTQYISGSISPGGTYTFTVPMKTPASAGSYYDYWSFKSPAGATIKVGGSNTIWALIQVVGPPNLKPYTPAGWSAPITASFVTGTTTSSNVVYACQPTYIDWAITNNGSTSAAGTFYSRMYLDGAQIGSWTTANLGTGSSATITDWAYTLPLGNHTLKLVTDDTGAITESSESDNVYSLSVLVDGCPPIATITTNSGNNFSTTNSTTTIQGTCVATDGGGISSVMIKNNASGYTSTIGGTTNFTFNNVSLVQGTNAITVTCSGAGSLPSSDAITVTANLVGTLSGTVTTTSGSALASATVKAIGPSTISTTTNSSGQYTLSGLAVGTYSVKATLGGYYDSAVQNISVSAGNNYSANFTLTKIPTPSLFYSPTTVSVTMNSGSLNSTQSFIIRNDGDATLSYTLSPNTSWASIQRNGATVSGVQQSLAPGIQAAFTVVFNSNGITTSQSGAIAISSNDATQSGASISLGLGLNAPPPPPPPPPPAEQPPPSTPPFQPAAYGQCQLQNRCYADPVNTAIGNYIYQHTDLAIAARGPDLIFARHYNSLDTTIGSLGLGWTHNLNIYLVIAGNGDVYVRWGTGQTDWYTYNSGTGGFTPPAGGFDQLTKGSQYILTDKDQNVWLFSAAGQLQSITDRLNNKLNLTYDAQNRLSTATNSVGDTFTYAYVSPTDSRLASVTDSTSRKIQLTYNGNQLTQVTDAKGNSSVLAYDGSNRLNQITERDGKVLVNNIYDSSHRVTSQTDALGNTTQFAYNTPAAGQTSITDPAGRIHIYAYDALYRLISQKGPSGDQVSFLYTTANLPSQVTDANGKLTSSTYDNRGNVLSVTDASGATSSWSYDVLDRVTSVTNPLGQTTSYSYDTNGNLSQISSTLNGIIHATALSYLPTGELASTTDPMGGVTTYTYNSKGDLTAIKNANNETVQFGYDALHRRTSVTDPLGHGRATTYDANDNPTSVTNALSQSLAISYDARDQQSAVVAPAGTTTFTYDSAGHLTQVTTPKGTTSYTYNAVNQQTAVTDPAGNKTTFTYNTLGYLTGMTDPTGKGVTFAYDPMGNVVSSTDTAGKTTAFTLDASGRPTKITDPLGNAVATTYNSAGLPTQTADPAGNTFKTAYDTFGRPTQSTNALQGVTAQNYDKNSRLAQVTVPSGAAHSWSYDAVGRITLLTSPSGKKKSFTYDAAGRLASFTNASNQTTSFTYDAGDRITQTSFADGAVRSITYDSANRPTQLAFAGKARTYAYDTAGRISSCVDAWGKAIGYAYNAAGQLASLTYPGNKLVAYGYDAAGRLTSVTDWNGGVTAYTYDAAGRLQQTLFPNGIKTTLSYDSASRVTAIQHKKSDGTVVYGQTVAYDNRGNVTSSDITPEPTGWITADSVTYTANAEDQYTGVGSDILGYDPVGQMLSRTSGTSYTFDARERMTAALTPTVNASFTYGPGGERIQKVVDGTATRYVVDTNRSLPAVIAELDANSVPTTYYIYGIGLLAQIPATGTAAHYYHTDLQSNVVALTDATGAVTDTYFYHPFGKVLAKTGTTANPYLFAGALGVEQDETGLNYMRARYYDPIIGRFISKDPLGLAAGVNQYGYGNNNPMRFTDPSGLCLWDFCVAEVYIAATAYVTALVTSPDLQADINFIAYDASEWSNDHSFMNGLALVMDSAAALIPGVTGAGSTTRSIGKSVDQVVNNMIDGGVKMGGVYGKAETRLLNAKVATELEEKGYEIVNIGSKELGMKEKYLPGIGGGTKGSAKVDVTAVGNGKTINVNTIDTYSNGMASVREATNAERIRMLDPSSELYLVAKSALKQAGPYLPQIESISKNILPHLGGFGAMTGAVINYFAESAQSMSGGSGK